MKQILSTEKFNTILLEHDKWLRGDVGGKQADLSGMELRNISLKGINLSHAILEGTNFDESSLESADLSYANLKKATFKNADLSYANLRGTFLRHVDFRGTNLTETDFKDANIDSSCLCFWCGTLKTDFDDKQLIQIAYHLVKSGLDSKNATDETKKELSKLITFANKFHRIDENGILNKKIENVNIK